MSSFGYAWFISASSFTLLGVPVVFAYKRIVRHYTLQTLVACQSALLSFVHHMCYETEIQMCFGQDPIFTQALDILLAFLMMVLMVAPFVECWATRDDLGHHSHGRYWRERYELCMGVMATIMVAFRQDGLETYLVLAIVAGVVLLWVGYREYQSSIKMDHIAKSFGWKLGLLGAVVWAIALALTFGMYKSPQNGFQTQRDWHGWFHVTSGVTVTLFACLLPDYDNLPKYEVDPLEVRQVMTVQIVPTRGKGTKYSQVAH
jgi:hypothetical protein